MGLCEFHFFGTGIGRIGCNVKGTSDSFGTL